MVTSRAPSAACGRSNAAKSGTCGGLPNKYLSNMGTACAGRRCVMVRIRDKMRGPVQRFRPGRLAKSRLATTRGISQNYNAPIARCRSDGHKDLAGQTRRGLRGRLQAGKSGGGNALGCDVARRVFALSADPRTRSPASACSTPTGVGSAPLRHGPGRRRPGRCRAGAA